MAIVIKMEAYHDYRLGLITKDELMAGKTFPDIVDEKVEALNMEEFDDFVQSMFTLNRR